MHRPYDRKLILEDGTEFYGYGFGAEKEALLEVVFNTSMVGYQEILSDPSYAGQGVVMTYPLIGNYGMCEEDYETDTPAISGLIVREYNDKPSNFRSTKTLGQVMKKYDIAGLSAVDTRKLTKHIRTIGSCKGLITAAETEPSEGMKRLAVPLSEDVVARVSCKHIWCSSTAEPVKYHVVAIDCGIKHNIIRSLNRLGCQVTIVPWNTPAKTIEAMKPDGIFLSNGPGDPSCLHETIETIRRLRGKYPIFGICLGHQLIALSYGAATYKLKFGHRGGNHPVKNLTTGKTEITSQNHSYAVEEDNLKKTPLRVTHRNLLDGTVEGLECKEDRLFCVQYHPESAPGPQDSSYLFNQFIQMMEGNHHAEKN